MFNRFTVQAPFIFDQFWRSACWFLNTQFHTIEYRGIYSPATETSPKLDDSTPYCLYDNSMIVNMRRQIPRSAFSRIKYSCI